jgi:hypothetical protein
LQNQPLTSNDQAKLLFFSLLLLASIIFLLVGLIPVIFLAFGIHMMKKNQDFSSIDTAVKYFKVYWQIAFICNCLFTLAAVGYDLSFRGNEWQLGFLYAVISGVYIIAVKLLFYSPLKEHSEWVAINGIFSTKPKSDSKPNINSEMDIIKGEKLKQYSVADELSKWAKLKEDGHISDEEFNEARVKLLKRN